MAEGTETAQEFIERLMRLYFASYEQGPALWAATVRSLVGEVEFRERAFRPDKEADRGKVTRRSRA